MDQNLSYDENIEIVQRQRVLLVEAARGVLTAGGKLLISGFLTSRGRSPGTCSSY